MPPTCGEGGRRADTGDNAGTKGGGCVEGVAQHDRAPPETDAGGAEDGRGESWDLRAGKGSDWHREPRPLPGVGVPCVCPQTDSCSACSPQTLNKGSLNWIYTF